MATNIYKSPYGSVNLGGLNQRQQTRAQFLANNNRMGEANRSIRKWRIPKAPAPAQNTQPVVSSQGIANAQPPAPTSPTQDTTNTVFPNSQMFEPKNYQGSPLYQFQVKTGEDQLAKSLAAKGLTNSGAAIQQELNIPMMAAAQDTDRMQQNANNNANRLQSYQMAEADRLERAGNNQWDRGLSLAQLMAQQSPWQAALGGLDQTGSLTKEQGKSLANYLASQYSRGGGGRRGGSGFTPIALPSGPDFSNIQPAQISGNQSSSNGWQNVITGLLGSFL